MFSKATVFQLGRIPTRTFSTTGTRSLDISSLIQKSVSNVKAKELAAKAKADKEEERIKKLANTPKVEKKIISAKSLNDKYRSEFRRAPTPKETTNLNNFFFSSHIQLDWMTYNFIEMPGEAERQQTEQRKMKEIEESERKLSDLSDIVDFEDDEIDLDHEKPTTKEDGNKGFVKPFIKPGLPEVVFLGKCNVGKSTLLNALVCPSDHKKLQEYAFSSRVAGFTQTMNAFNIGNRLRIIDTPGYGVKGHPAQGQQVIEYLQNRKELRKCYLLVSAADGFNDHDYPVLDMLLDCGVPFDIVLTKVDKLKSAKIVARNIRKSGILDRPMKPELIFTSSLMNKKTVKREGFVELRKSIFESCGYEQDIKPLKRRQ